MISFKVVIGVFIKLPTQPNCLFGRLVIRFIRNSSILLRILSFYFYRSNLVAAWSASLFLLSQVECEHVHALVFYWVLLAVYWVGSMRLNTHGPDFMLYYFHYVVFRLEKRSWSRLRMLLLLGFFFWIAQFQEGFPVLLLTISPGVLGLFACLQCINSFEIAHTRRNSPRKFVLRVVQNTPFVERYLLKVFCSVKLNKTTPLKTFISCRWVWSEYWSLLRGTCYLEGLKWSGGGITTILNKLRVFPQFFWAIRIFEFWIGVFFRRKNLPRKDLYRTPLFSIEPDLVNWDQHFRKSAKYTRFVRRIIQPRSGWGLFKLLVSLLNYDLRHEVEHLKSSSSYTYNYRRLVDQQSLKWIYSNRSRVFDQSSSCFSRTGPDTAALYINWGPIWDRKSRTRNMKSNLLGFKKTFLQPGWELDQDQHNRRVFRQHVRSSHYTHHLITSPTHSFPTMDIHMRKLVKESKRYVDGPCQFSFDRRSVGPSLCWFSRDFAVSSTSARIFKMSRFEDRSDIFGGKVYQSLALLEDGWRTGQLLSPWLKPVFRNQYCYGYSRFSPFYYSRLDDFSFNPLTYSPLLRSLNSDQINLLSPEPHYSILQASTFFRPDDLLLTSTPSDYLEPQPRRLFWSMLLRGVVAWQNTPNGPVVHPFSYHPRNGSPLIENFSHPNQVVVDSVWDLSEFVLWSESAQLEEASFSIVHGDASNKKFPFCWDAVWLEDVDCRIDNTLSKLEDVYEEVTTPKEVLYLTKNVNLK